MLVSLLRCDERMLVTSLSDLADEGLNRPGYSSKEQRHRGFRFISESSITYSSAQSPPGRRPLLRPFRPTTGRGKRHRSVGACAAQDTAHTPKTAVELNGAGGTCKQGSVYARYLVDIGVDRDFPVLPNGNDSSSVDVAGPNVISPISRPPWHRRKVLRKSLTYPPQALLRRSCRF